VGARLSVVIAASLRGRHRCWFRANDRVWRGRAVGSGGL
jgi:hypothetical protein